MVYILNIKNSQNLIIRNKLLNKTGEIFKYLNIKYLNISLYQRRYVESK